MGQHMSRPLVEPNVQQSCPCLTRFMWVHVPAYVPVNLILHLITTLRA